MGPVARNVAVLLGGGALSVWSANGAFAQEIDETIMQVEGAATTPKQRRVTTLQRIVVGAGVEKVAIDTPQAVTVKDQEDIDLDQPASILEAIDDVPGVNTTGADRAFGQSFNIRGIGAPESAGEEGRIIVTVDGAVKYYEQYRMGSFFSDPELYKRVEVLRGPASSTLYGSGALGGVINFTTKDASDFIEDGKTGTLKLKGTYNSNRNGWMGSAVLAHRFSENFDVLISGNYRTSDPYETGNGTIIRSSDFESWSGLAKATAKVGDEGILRASYQHWDSDADDQDYAQIGGDGMNIFGTVDRHVVDRTAVVSWEDPFSDNDMLDLKVSASFSDTNVEQTDASGNPMFGITCATSLLICDTEYGYQTWQFKIENTSEWSGDNWENFLTYGWQTAYQVRTAEAITLPGTPSGINFHPEGTDFKTGFYIQDELIWDERLTIIPGVRLDWRKLTPDDSTSVAESDSDTAISPKIAAHYRFNDHLAVFGSVAHTERFPTLDEVFSTGGNSNTFLPSLDLNKERANNFEAGFAVSGYDLMQDGDSLQLKTTGFYNDIQDLIALNPALVPGPNAIPGYVNIQQARIYGAEVELAYEADYVFANASYTYTNGKNALTDAWLTSVAPHELGFTVGGKLPQHGVKFGWTARFVANPQDPARRSSDPLPTGSTRYAEAFNVHDVFVSWKPEDGALKGWEGIFGVDNIFNVQYKEFLRNEPSKGRTFKFTLAKKFDY